MKKSYKNKIITYDKLETISSSAKNGTNTIVTTNGCFDIIHRGHVEFLNRLSEFCDICIVGINSDKSVKKLKGNNRPINNEEDRAIVLASLYCVDYCIIFDEEEPSRFLGYAKPDIHVKGKDYSNKDIPERSIVEKYGGRIVFLPLVENISTTTIINKIKKCT